MIHSFETTWYSDISELRKQRDSSVAKCTDFSEKFQHLNAELEKKNKKLIGLRREYVVAERQIKDAQSEIFKIKEKRSKIDETAFSFLKEFERKETELAELNTKKHDFEADIDAMRNALQEISKELTLIETENKNGSQRAAQLLDEKFKISDEISKYLSKTSLEKDQIEEKFNDLNKAFIQSMEEREAVKRQMEHLKTTANMLPERVDKLKQQIELLEEVKVLMDEMRSIQTEVAKSEKEFLAVDSVLKERQTALAQKKGQLDFLLAENSEQKEKINLLEEDVQEYSGILSVFVASQQSINSARELFEQGADTLVRVLAEKIYLEKELQAFLDMVNLFEQIEIEIAP